ncbi:MAG: DUF433 domain-containing protein [Planctomycetes bacterium]|nr:DUF433 domain-containing protein [Planctomycetota bacterium]
MNWESRIAPDPEALAGTPVIRGTKVSVECVIGLLARGWSEAEVLRNHPGITREDLLACLAYAEKRVQTKPAARGEAEAHDGELRDHIARGDAFRFWDEPEEDVYSEEDGAPLGT